MSFIGMNETLCYGLHLGVIKRGSRMGLYADMRESNTLRLRACIEAMLLPRCELRDPTIDAGCSDSWCRESEAWLGLFLSVDGRCRRSEGLLLGCFPDGRGWVRNERIPERGGGGLVCGKPPSLNIPCVSPFGSGYPPIPFLW